MKQIQRYKYVGPKAILNRINKQFEGKTIKTPQDIIDWIQETNQKTLHEALTATFIINLNEELVITDRHSEHVLCAGGKAVLSAGEITFNFDEKALYIGAITNQSTGYCPKPQSWKYVNLALDKIKIEYPDYFTQAYEFRYCENCGNKNLIKEEIFECAICGAKLELEWNIDKMY